MLLECILDRFPLSITPKTRFFRALRAIRGFLFSPKFSNCWRGVFNFAQISPNFEEGCLPRGGGS